MTNSSIQITHATLSDIPDLCQLLNMLFTQEIEFKPNQEAQQRGLTAIINHSETGQILVARRAGNVIGMVNLLYTVSTALGARVGLLEDMVVAPDARNVGVGSQILQHAIQVAQNNGCKRITLLTDGANHLAQSFYQKHGFEISSMLVLRLRLDQE